MVGKYDASHCGDCGSCSNCLDCCDPTVPCWKITIYDFDDIDGETYYVPATGNCVWEFIKVFSPPGPGHSYLSIGVGVSILDEDTCRLSVIMERVRPFFGSYDVYYYDFSFPSSTCNDINEDIDSIFPASDSYIHIEASECPVDCDECDDSEGPAEFQLNVSSWGDGSCSDCNEVLNGTFVLFQLSPGCTWVSNYFTFCGDSFCRWQLTLNSGVLTVSLVNGISAQLWSWTWTHDGDCLNWTSVALTHSYTNPTYSGYCFAVGAVDVTAL